MKVCRYFSEEPGSSVGIAILYAMDVPGIDPRWRINILLSSGTAMELTQPLLLRVRGYLSRV
jgi:hypothetical protein